MLHSQLGTEPQQVLEYALAVFKQGDRDRGLHPREFDRIIVVFDRDEHQSHHAALAQAAAQNGKLRNDNGVAVPLEAVASVPCFELWLLLHPSFAARRARFTARRARHALLDHNRPGRLQRCRIRLPRHSPSGRARRSEHPRTPNRLPAGTGSW